MRVSVFATALIFILPFYNCSENNSGKETTSEAVEAIQSWLVLIDDGKFIQSWEETGSLFKNQIPDSQWVKTMENSRKPFGKVISRKVKSAQFKKSLPGVPDGQYVVAVFKTEFENKKQAVETVSATNEIKQWKVVGYFIR